MRFLFINQYYAPDYAATAQQLSDLCEKLAELGHEVHVLTSRSLYDGRKFELPQHEILNGVHVHRVGIGSPGRDRFRQRLMGYLSFYLKSFFKANIIPKPDVVITLTTPPMISLVGTMLRVLYRSRFVYWVMDIYPDIAMKAHVLSPWGPIRTVWSTIGRVSYLTANRVVVLGDDMRDVLKQKSVGEHKIDVINSWACGEEICPIPREENEFHGEHVRPGRFSVMYSGNMGTCHSFESVKQAVSELKDDERFEFLFIGGGKQRPELEECLGDKENVKFLPYQDRTKLSESLSAPDIHLITLQSRYDGLLVPSKIYGIMAAARPVLFVGSHANEIARIIKRSGCGVVVPEDSPEELREVLERLAANPQEAAEMGRKGRDYFERYYDREIGVTKFALMLEKEGLQPGVRGMRTLAHKTLSLVTVDGMSDERAESFAAEGKN